MPIVTVATIESAAATAGAAVFNRALDSMRAGIAQTNASLDRMTGASSLLRGAFASLGAALTVKSVVDAADEYTRLKLQLESLKGSAEAGAETLTKIREAARNARVPTSDLASAFVAMSFSLKDNNRTEAEGIRSLELLAKAMTASGATIEQTRGALDSLQTGFIRGRFDMRQFFGLVEQAPIIMQELQRQTGLSTLQLRKMAELGKISGDTLIGVLFNAADKIEDRFARAPRTLANSFSGVVSALSDTLGRAFSDSGGAASEFVKAMDAVKAAVRSEEFKKNARTFADTIGLVVQKLVEMNSGKMTFEFNLTKAGNAWADTWNNISSTVSDAVDRVTIKIMEADARWTISGKTREITSPWYLEAKRIQQATAEADNYAWAIAQVGKAKAAAAAVGSDWAAATTTTRAPSGSNSPVKFAESDLEKQTKIMLAAERDRNALIKARAVDDRNAINAAEEELEVKQKVTKELRVASPLLAGQLEAQIRINSAAQREADIRRENNEIGKQAMSTINDGIIEGIKSGKKFGDVLRDLTAKLIEMIAKVAILKPLENSIGTGIGGLLSGAGFNPQTGITGGLGSLFGFADGGDFRVGGSGGTDSQVVAFKASPDERVSIRRPGQSAGRSDGGQIVVNFAPVIQGDATDATVAKMRMMAETVFAQRSPQTVRSAVNAVADAHRRDRSYLAR